MPSLVALVRACALLVGLAAPARAVPFLFNMLNTTVTTAANDGVIYWARGDNFTPVPGLTLGFILMQGGPGMLRIPHWHPTTVELGTVITGTLRVTVAFDGTHETFLLEPGDTFYSPPGYYHYLEQVSEENVTMMAVFKTPALSTLDMTQVFGQLRAIAPEALVHTFRTTPQVISALFAHNPNQTKFTFDLPQPNYKYDASTLTKKPSCFKFSNLEAGRTAEPYYTGSTIEWLTEGTSPGLMQLSFARVVIQPGGWREPQWSINADEIAFVMGTGGAKEGIVIGVAGATKAEKNFARLWDFVWTPAQYVSYFFNNGTAPVTLLLIYDNANPGFISLREAYGVTPKEVLATMHHAANASVFSTFGSLKDLTPNPPGISGMCPSGAKPTKKPTKKAG